MVLEVLYDCAVICGGYIFSFLFAFIKVVYVVSGQAESTIDTGFQQDSD